MKLIYFNVYALPGGHHSTIFKLIPNG